MTFDSALDLSSNLAWWRMHAFPGVVVIPMLLFFAGVVTYTPTRHVGFAKTLATLVVMTLPLAGILGALGMFHPRYKGMDRPPIYISEVFMFLLPVTAVSFLLIYTRSRPLPEGKSSTVESLSSGKNTTTEPAGPPCSGE